MVQNSVPSPASKPNYTRQRLPWEKRSGRERFNRSFTRQNCSSAKPNRLPLFFPPGSTSRQLARSSSHLKITMNKPRGLDFSILKKRTETLDWAERIYRKMRDSVEPMIARGVVIFPPE